MPVKIILTWDVHPEREQEYFDFVAREFIPALQQLGLQPVEAWATLYGNQPQIQVEILASNLLNARRALASEVWTALLKKLLELVENYRQKIIPACGGFQF
ncbi:MAG: hypothetical protein RMJ60_10420 [Anaerolineales bacterium]|nr:hypothetical protein [Anaerolineales bacterium]